MPGGVLVMQQEPKLDGWHGITEQDGWVVLVLLAQGIQLLVFDLVPCGDIGIKDTNGNAFVLQNFFYAFGQTCSRLGSKEARANLDAIAAQRFEVREVPLLRYACTYDGGYRAAPLFERCLSCHISFI